MRALVTGSTGLLGNNLVRAVLDAGHEVWALARSKEKAQRELAGLGDIRNVSDFAYDLRGPFPAVLLEPRHATIDRCSSVAESSSIACGSCGPIMRFPSRVDQQIAPLEPNNFELVGKRMPRFFPDCPSCAQRLDIPRLSVLHGLRAVQRYFVHVAAVTDAS
jgi:NAD dependent epimerase/dehydratase family